MAGNCEIGRFEIATPPTINVMMAMTIATMGRLMKNLDMLVALHKRLRADFHAGTHLLRALGHYALACLESFGYDPHGSDLSADFHLANVHGVGVVHNDHLIAAL